jgi:hypothetical protein
MTVYQDLHCDVDTSRDQVAEHAFVNGIDFLEVVTEPAAENQRVLWVSFIPKPDPAHEASLEALLDDIVLLHQNDPKVVTIDGGVRVRGILVEELTRVERRLRIRVDQPGDFSDYTLTIHRVFGLGDDPSNPPAKLHPAYASVVFNFKAGCPSRFDCRGGECAPGATAAPAINIDYLARDYASFRQSLLDLIPSLHPDWIERNPADLGITLVELMAYAADHLSYYQDAVANEAFLATARQRISVRRHARLIDYAMHDGASARLFVFVEVALGGAGIIRDGTPIVTRITTPIAGKEAPHPEVITDTYVSLDAAARAAQAVFEVFGGRLLNEKKNLRGLPVDPALNELTLYRWGRTNCCLPRGSTRADVRAGVATLLQPGDLVLFEETSVDADPEHRQVVRLIAVEELFDPLTPNTQLTRLIWHEEDALRFPLCVNGQDAPIGVARGNILLADHGRSIPAEWHPAQPGGLEEGIAPRRDRAYRFFLEEGPLSYRVETTREISVASLLLTDPHVTTPQIAVAVESGGDLTPWSPQPDLLSSFSTSPHFAVETDNDGRAMIRFGDGTAGMAPPKGVYIRSSYRVGVGRSGNVGSGALAHILHAPPSDPEPGEVFPDVDALRNPLPSWGGVPPETLDEVRLTAPATLRTRSDRAVTEDDYARAAMLHPQVSKAVATLRWTGTWHTVFVTIDPKGRLETTEKLQESVKEWLTGVLQTGYDLEIDPPAYVPVELEVDVCVKPGHFRSDVEKDVLAALASSGSGFFHPDRFTFGQPLYLSQIYAAVMKVEGVAAVEVTALHRYGDGPAGELARGALTVGRTEVIRLDNDPNFPDNGVLRILTGSGK